MTTHTPLGGNQALSLGLPDFSASWPVIAFAAGAIILFALAAVLMIAFMPRHGARHAHGPRHAKPETTSMGRKQRIAAGVLGDGQVLPQARSIAVETRPDNSMSNWWARA